MLMLAFRRNRKKKAGKKALTVHQLVLWIVSPFFKFSFNLSSLDGGGTFPQDAADVVKLVSVPRKSKAVI